MKVNVRKYDPTQRPNLERTVTVVLKDGPKVRRVAKHTVVLNEHTGEFHHDSLTIKTYALNKRTCTLDPGRSVHLDGEELQRLMEFMRSSRGGGLPVKAGGYVVLPTPETFNDEASRKLHDLTDAAGAEALAILLRQAVEKPDLLRAVMERAAERGDEFFAEAAAALNLVVYRRAVVQLEDLIESPGAREADFQRLLTANPWMFGSEYSRLLDIRRLTRDEQQDFLFSRTTDGYIEVVEIKTPLGGDALFAYDRSPDTYYPKADLSKVLAQVENYLEKLDRRRDTILADDGVDAHKVRAKAVIGRDGDEHQIRALRRLNGHLHGIEVITFDGLLRIARRVLSYLEDPAEPGGSAPETDSLD